MIIARRIASALGVSLSLVRSGSLGALCATLVLRALRRKGGRLYADSLLRTRRRRAPWGVGDLGLHRPRRRAAAPAPARRPGRYSRQEPPRSSRGDQHRRTEQCLRRRREDRGVRIQGQAKGRARHAAPSTQDRTTRPRPGVGSHNSGTRLASEGFRPRSRWASMGDVDEGDRRGVDRPTIQEAARRLGISEGAGRKRVTRGSLKHEKEDDGRVYVYLDAGGRRRVDAGQDEGVDPNSNALISQLRDEVVYLRDENRRKDEIIMQQAMTMRQLTAAPQQPEATEAAETVEEQPEEAEPHPASGEAQESEQRRSWWRRIFGS